jgi:hypothetical protein
MIKVLIACEFSGIVREAFKTRGHDAWSCDLEPTEIPGNHYQCDVRELFSMHWDLMIAHPPCTNLCVSGNSTNKYRPTAVQDSLNFFRDCLEAPIQKICVENPVSVASTWIRKPDQIIQPWQFGDPYVKTTCLWLKNLPKLKYTNVLPEILVPIAPCSAEFYSPNRQEYSYRLGPSSTRSKDRSRTYLGIAKAIAEQYG